MADVSSWSRLGTLVTKHQKVQAIIDTDYMGTRYYFTGPPRGDDEQQALRDLCYIRAAAEGSLSHVDGLCAMQVAAKLLRDEAKALARGGVMQDAGSYHARFRYIDAGITEKKILGPPRQSERRAENDLATLREAARAQKTSYRPQANGGDHPVRFELQSLRISDRLA